MQKIVTHLPNMDEYADILLLIGRDLGAIHHGHIQVVGPDDGLFAQRLALGWVVIGQVCLGQMHMDEDVN